MKLLFIHRRFPAQFKSLIHHFATQLKCEVWGITAEDHVHRLEADRQVPADVSLMGYFDPMLQQKNSPLEVGFDHSFRTGAAVAHSCRQLSARGFVPDVIVSYCANGEALYVRDIFPQAKVILYADFMPSGPLQEPFNIGELKFSVSPDAFLLFGINRANSLLALDRCDVAIAQTHWQKASFPGAYQSRMRVIYDGVDTDFIQPKERDPKDEMITYTAPHLEPVRGFHVFMRALPEIQRLRPNARIQIVGDDGVSYSTPLPNGMQFRTLLLKELEGKLDLSRLTFIPRLPYREYVEVLQRSTVHVYLTSPFVLSWSSLEAMAAGCVVIGSKTPPVEEIIQDGVNGFLVDYPSPEALSEKVVKTLERKEGLNLIRKAARKLVEEKYDLKRCLAKQVSLVEGLLS